jgi:hypothetical protein
VRHSFFTSRSASDANTTPRIISSPQRGTLHAFDILSSRTTVPVEAAPLDHAKPLSGSFRIYQGISALTVS